MVGVKRIYQCLDNDSVLEYTLASTTEFGLSQYLFQWSNPFACSLNLFVLFDECFKRDYICGWLGLRNN